MSYTPSKETVQCNVAVLILCSTDTESCTVVVKQPGWGLHGESTDPRQPTEAILDQSRLLWQSWGKGQVEVILLTLGFNFCTSKHYLHLNSLLWNEGLVVSHNDFSEFNTIHELNISSASRSGRKVVVSSWLHPHNLIYTPPREWAKEEETVEGKNAIDMLQYPKHDATTRERRDPWIGGTVS